MDWVDLVTQGVYTMLCTSLACVTLTGLVLVLAFFLLRVLAGRVKAGQEESDVSVGFFHPYCNAAVMLVVGGRGCCGVQSGQYR